HVLREIPRHLGAHGLRQDRRHHRDRGRDGAGRRSGLPAEHRRTAQARGARHPGPPYRGGAGRDDRTSAADRRGHAVARRPGGGQAGRMSTSRRLALVLGFTQTLAWATTYYIPAVIVGPAAATLHRSTTELLVGYSWSLLVAGLASPRVGSWIDRHGGRGALATGTVVMAVGLLVLAGWPSLAGWYAAWTIIGAGMALGLYDAAFATIGGLLGLEARPAIVGVTLLAGFASTVGWPVGVALVHRFDWRATVAIYAGVQLAVNLPLILALIPPARPVAPVHVAGAPVVSGGSGGFLALLLLGTFFCTRAGISAVVSVHALTLLHGVGLTAAAAVGVAALFGPSQVFGRVLEWVFARWIDPLTGSWMGAALLPLGVAGLLLGGPAVG